jgi:hypothetical protein
MIKKIKGKTKTKMRKNKKNNATKEVTANL